MFRATLCPSSGADDKTTESSAPEDGHKVARNMLSYLYRENKHNTKWHLVGFLFHTV